VTDFVLKPIFIDSPQGRIFIVHRYPAATQAVSGIVLIPPFAEEMNKSRRMFTLLAEALACQGFHVALLDLYGTGESEGDFADASWNIWLENIELCMTEMRKQGVEFFSFVGLRAGALLVLDYLQRYQVELERLVFWQPVIDGATYLNQFLRLRLASSMLRGGGEKETTQSIKQLLAAGEYVEVAGYALSSQVSDGLEAVSLKQTDLNRLPQTLWLDLVSNEGQAAPLMNRKLIESWRQQGFSIEANTIVGEPFWGSVEIVEVDAMVQQTADFFKGLVHAKP